MNNNEKQYEDDILNDDLPGNNARYKLKHRNDVRLNYDSDSSLEDYRDDQEDKRINDNDKEEESNDDMFASDEDDKDGDDKEDRIKDTEIVDGLQHTEAFEKDEFDNPINDNYKLNPIYESEDDNESNEDNKSGQINKTKIDYYTNIEHMDYVESAAHLAKNKLAPKIEAFDLHEETDEGNFDENGNFIRNNYDDDDDNQDEWMDLKKGDIERAKKAQLERNRLDKERRMKESADEFIPINRILSDLIELLEPVETPMEALTRFSPPKKSRSKKKVHNIEKDQERKKIVIRLTDLCDKLINKKGVVDAYELTREELMRRYKQETGNDYNQESRGQKRTREDYEDNNENDDYGDRIWEFKWIGQDEIHGPYSEFEMYHWSKDYFQDSVVVRKIGETGFKPIINVNFDLNNIS